MRKKMMFVVAFVLALTLILIFTTASAKKKGELAEEAEGQLTIAWVPQTVAGDESSQAYTIGVTTAAERLGLKLLVDDADWNAAKQIDIVETFIIRGVDGIVSEPIDAALATAGVEKANEAGIPFIPIVSGVDGGTTLLTVNGDLEKMGELAAQRIVDELEKKYGSPKGKVLEVMGVLGSQYTQRISTGLNGVFDRYDNIEIIQKACDWDNSCAEATVVDVITANPDLDAIFTNSDYYIEGVDSGLNTLNRLIEVGKEGHIIWTSVDGFPKALEFIGKGYMDGTSNSPASNYGDLAVTYLYEYLTNGTVLKAGEIVDEKGAVWAPAEVIDGPTGPVLLLKTTFIDASWDLDDPRLWANQVDVGG